MGEMVTLVDSNVMSDHNHCFSADDEIDETVTYVTGESLTSVASNVMSDHNHSFSADDKIDETVIYVMGKC